MSQAQSDILSPDEQDYLYRNIDMDEVVSFFNEKDTVIDDGTDFIDDEDFKKNVPMLPPVAENVLSNERYLGNYEFEVNIPPHGSKNSWVYSPTLHKVYMNMRNQFPVDFKIKNRPMTSLFIRITPVYSSPQFAQECVYRCINHEYVMEKADQNIQEHVRQHIVRCANSGAQYLGDKNKNERLSVIIPFSYPQTGTDSVREMFEFVCKNSCPTPGMNRRAIEIIFTLEDDIGTILGRQTLHVRVCSCPKRDKEKDEKEYNKGKDRPPQGKKRKIEKSEKKVAIDTEELTKYQLTIPIVGRHNVQCVLEYCHDRMAGEIVRPENKDNVEEYRRCMNEIDTLIKESLG